MKRSWVVSIVIVILSAALLLVISLATATPGQTEQALLAPEAASGGPLPVPDSGVANMVVAAGSTPVAVTGYFINPKGTVEATVVATLGAHGSVLFAPTVANLRKDWIGSVALSPNNAVGSIAEVYWRGSKLGTNKPIESSAYEAVASPGTVAYLPFVAYVPDNPNTQFSRISVAGSGDITLQYFNREGTPVPPTPLADTLGAGGHKTYDLHIPSALNPTFGTSAWVGSLKITSQEGQSISAVESHYWANRGVLSYPSSASGATRNFVPGVERRFEATTTTTPTPNLLGFSVITAQCLDQSTACSVKMEFYNPGTPTPVATLTCSVAPNAARAANTNSGGDCPVGASLTSLGDSFNGSVVVSSTNDKNLAVVAYTVRPGSAMMDGFRSATAADASTWSFAPAAYQKASPTTQTPAPSCTGWNWTQYSIIYIQNPSATAQAKARLHFYPRVASPGAPTLSYPTLANITPIPPNGFQVFNTKNHCADIWLGTAGQSVNWEGSLHVEAVEGTVVVIVKTIGPGSVMSAYNAFGY